MKENFKGNALSRTICLPLAEPDRRERINDGYILTEGETIKEVGHYTAEVGNLIQAEYRGALRIYGAAGGSSHGSSKSPATRRYSCRHL